jgi:hypothetical protein
MLSYIFYLVRLINHKVYGCVDKISTDFDRGG